MMGDGVNFTTMGYGANGIFWILLIILIVWLYSVFTNRNKNIDDLTKKSQEQYKADKILRERYAKGEIDLDEFNKRLTNLHRDIKS